MLPNFDYIRPTSLDEAIAKAAVGGARLHAGGTDLLGCLRDGVFSATGAGSLSSLVPTITARATPTHTSQFGNRPDRRAKTDVARMTTTPAITHPTMNR